MKTRTVISKAQKKRATPKGSQQFLKTEMVVYKSGKKGNQKSITKHEITK